MKNWKWAVGSGKWERPGTWDLGLWTKKLGFCTLVLLSPLVSAEDSIEKENWYQVEVIIFSQQDHYQEEANRRDIELSYPDNLIELNAKEEVPGQITQEEPFIRLGKSERKLNPDVYSLNRTGVYNVLFHEAWRQPGLNNRDAPWVLIRGGDAVAEHHTLEGTVRLVLSRFLHLEANVWKTRFSQAENQSEQNDALPWPELPPQPELPDRYQAFNTQSELFPAEPEPLLKTKYPPVEDIAAIQQSRRLKLGEVHYLDHPDMGLLVMVSRYELPKKEVPLAEPGNGQMNKTDSIRLEN